jgi:tRNA1Val (adenine37-N6)-methyltransferase
MISKPEVAIPPDETLEPFGQGRLWVFQKKQGYRFSLDAVLLAGLTELATGARVVDLGTGCGIVALLLARRFPLCSLVGVESQPALSSLAARNVRVNGLTGRVEIITGRMQNLSEHFSPASFDVAVSNPPYRPLGSGRLNPLAEKAIARHELEGSLELAAQTAAYLLPPGGRLFLIYPAWRLVHLCCGLRTNNLELKTVRFIHSRWGEEAKLVWAEARKGGGEELKVLPPLFVYTPGGDYTGELDQILNF